MIEITIGITIESAVERPNPIFTRGVEAAHISRWKRIAARRRRGHARVRGLLIVLVDSKRHAESVRPIILQDDLLRVARIN